MPSAPVRRARIFVLLVSLAGLGALGVLVPGPVGAAPVLQAPAPAGPVIARIAAAELRRGSGETPRGSNAGPDVRRYRTATVGARAGSPWCAYFASWVARAAGFPIGTDGRGVSSAAELAGWARRAGRWSSRPTVGALLVLPEHVGIVVAVHGGAVVSIDGNWSDRVTRVARSAVEAIGYVTPPRPDVLLMDPLQSIGANQNQASIRG